MLNPYCILEGSMVHHGTDKCNLYPFSAQIPYMICYPYHNVQHSLDLGWVGVILNCPNSEADGGLECSRGIGDAESHISIHENE